jgi:hypothetical protein
MIVAELEVYHSRPVAPTRRVALGHMTLPVDPPPGFGGVLLGGIVARHVGSLDPELVPDLSRLTLQLENDMSISQPRLRYRFQRDRVGLLRSTHRLFGEGDVLHYGFDDGDGAPTQQLLGAVYAAGQLPTRARGPVMGAIRRALGWQGPVGAELIAALAGFGAGTTWSAQALAHPVEWALGVLGFTSADAHGAASDDGGAGGNGRGPGPHITRNGIGPSRREIQQQFRRRLIEAHPDHGGQSEAAAQRIADLTEARRILLG